MKANVIQSFVLPQIYHEWYAYPSHTLYMAAIQQRHIPTTVGMEGVYVFLKI